MRLVGTQSVFATFVVAGMWVATGTLNRSRLARRLCLLAAPLILLCLSAVTKGSPFAQWASPRSFPDTEDYVAAFIYMAFGVGFGLQLLRQRPYVDRAVGVMVIAIHGGHIMASVLSIMCECVAMGDASTLRAVAWSSLPGVLLLVSAGVCGLSGLIRRRGRKQGGPADGAQ